MPQTPRSVSAAPSTISRPPSGSFSPVSTSVSVPVIASDSALTSSSGSGFSSVPLSACSARVYHYWASSFGRGVRIAICFQSSNFLKIGKGALIPFLPHLRLRFRRRVWFLLNYSPSALSFSKNFLHAPIWFLGSGSTLRCSRAGIKFSQLSGPRGSRPCQLGVTFSHPGQPDFVAPLRVVA